ncbi:hypothetical protein VNO77_17065 [Canavalia gladiata]|uniref:Rho termination factor N-terminal domain-containing protein n=1 Tax=Canavalia gladiata TaxID=3824 RepID=A0AAN9LIA9_CANGL
MLNVIVNVTEHAVDKDSSTIDSNINEEGKKSVKPQKTGSSTELLLEIHEKRSDNPEKIEIEKALLFVAQHNLQKHTSVCCCVHFPLTLPLPPTPSSALNSATFRNPRYSNRISFSGYSYLQFMAWDLWSSSCDQDVIEEDALNEESCVRVLRILITKADTEIEELEKDLLSLQNELAWAEHEKWADICCSALTERINWLGDAVSALKNEHAGDTEMQLLLHSEPAETLHEIMKALKRAHCQDAFGQFFQELQQKKLQNVTEHALDKDSSTIDSNIKVEGKELCETSENSSSELLLEINEGSDNPEKIELLFLTHSPRPQSVATILDPNNLCGPLNRELPEKSLVGSPDLGAIICAPDNSDGMKLSETSDNIVIGNEEVRRKQHIATDTGQILNLFSAKGNGNIPSEAKMQEKENEIVKEKDVGSDVLRLATGVEGRKKYSRLDTSQQRKSGNSDLDKKLCDFAPKIARRACKKESNVSPDEDLDSLNLPLQVVYPQTLCIAETEFCSFKGSNGNNCGQPMSIENATHIDAENSALISLQGMQTESSLYTGLQLTDVEKPQAQDLESETAASLCNSNVFPSKLKAQGKQRPEFEALPARKPHDSCTEVIPSTSIIVSTKRQRKSKPCNDGAVLNDSMNRRTTKRAAQPGQHETEGRAIVLYDSKFSEFQKKKRVSKLPITVEIQNSTVNVDVPNSDGVSTDNRSQVDLHIGKSYSLVDSNNGTSSLLPITLKSLTLSNLRAMAKQHNVRKYYKLPKGALVEQLVERLSSSC